MPSNSDRTTSSAGFEGRARRSRFAAWAVPPEGRGSRKAPLARWFVAGSFVLGLLGESRTTAGEITREEALAAVYPGAAITAERVFLTREQKDEASRVAGVRVSSALVARYLAMKDGRLIGRAYVDTHVVRTKKESLLISLDEHGQVRRIDVTAFLEPAEYQASSVWLEQYRGRPLTDDLKLQRAIRPLAGATLTALAANDAVRRVLGIDAVLTSRAGAVR